MIKKGSLCSINGNKYEISIYKILKKCEINNNKFNTQEIKDLGSSTNNNDIICNYKINFDIPIEIKKYNTPDWMQLSLKYDNINNKWIGSENNKIPNNSKKIFEDGFTLLTDKKYPGTFVCINSNGLTILFIYSSVGICVWLVSISSNSIFNNCV